MPLVHADPAQWFWPAGLALCGAILGSFIATLVIRWPAGRSVMAGRSACDGCKRMLAPVELVPILSGLWLRGNCRTCGAPIDPLHAGLELAAVAIGLVSGLLLPGGQGIAAALFGWLLLTLGALDWRAFWLPDLVTLLLALAGVAVALLDIGPPLGDRLIGGVAGFCTLWAIGAGYKLVRGREGLGGGDPKLLGAIGLWVGWRMLPIVVVLASMAGLGTVLFWLLTGRGVRRDDRLPFGTLLAIAAYPAWVAMIVLMP